MVQGRLYYWDRYVTAQFIDLLNRCKFNENVKEIKILTSVFSKKVGLTYFAKHIIEIQQQHEAGND